LPGDRKSERWIRRCRQLLEVMIDSFVVARAGAADEQGLFLRLDSNNRWIRSAPREQ
jgi:hypothetical protein